MAYVITLKAPQMQVYVKEPLVGGEWTREEWERDAGAVLESKGSYEETNDAAFRNTLMERPFLVCRKFTTGLRVVVFLENIGLIEEVPDERARRVLEEIQAQIKAASEKAGRDAGGRKTAPSPLIKPGLRIPGGGY